MKRTIFLVLITALITTIVILLDNKTFSRYVSSTSEKIAVNIAVPIVNDNREQTLSYEIDDINPGETKTYNFSVTNFEGEITSKVNLDYTIQIFKSNNIPLTVSLYKNDSVTSCLNENLACGPFVLWHAAVQTDSYRLVLFWDQSNNAEEYNGLTDHLDIKISSVQKLD